MRIFYSLVITILLATTYIVNAQQKTTVLPGALKGIVRDTVHNYVLRSATVSIYKASDNTLISYQISNNYGEFSFKNLPTGVDLKIAISHVGYQAYFNNFNIPILTNQIDLKVIAIKPKDNTLKEITVTIPPVSMNGDTLEFNAAAFKLDSNAVVEDLLRKIPNITLWGDGIITVNGREVKSLLVNGKQFFGGDFKVATQNISKNALEKVQVYSVAQDQSSNPLDSTLQMNLKLKKGKDIGYFGKIGAGYGNRNRFEADANLNIFSPKLQLGIIGASNNINKVANDTKKLVANSTFKGAGTSIDYQPDFRMVGLNQPNAGGLTFEYNFIEKPTYNNKNALSANYFVQNKNTENLIDRQTTTTTNVDNKIFENYKNTNHLVSVNQKFDSKYELIKKEHTLTLNQALNYNNSESTNTIFRNAVDNFQIPTSTNNAQTSSNNTTKSFNFNADYRYMNNSFGQKKLINNFTAKYNLTVNENKGENTNITEFRSFVNPSLNKNFNRKYNINSNTLNQSLDIELRNLKSAVFGKSKLWDLDFSITNKLKIENKKENNLVSDLNSPTTSYIQNNYLSNNLQTDLIDVLPGLKITKSYRKSLSNRYSKNITFSLAANQNFIFQQNKSIKSFQNINTNYNRFVPEINITYNNIQFGDYSRFYSLKLGTKIDIPTIQQLAPLTDSTNLYYLQKGNVNLKEATDRSLTFSFVNNDMKTKNTLNYNIFISAGLVENKIVDSLFIDNQNRRTIYLTNGNGSKYFNFSGSIKKAFKLKTSEFQLSLNPYIRFEKNPAYINNVFTYSNNFNSNTSIKANYTYKDYLAIELSPSYSYYSSKQAALDTKYTGNTISTALSAVYNITKKLTINSNVNFNNNKSANTNSINFTILNASASYRFLKGNNAELKLAALDILGENTSIINYGGANSYTFGTQNVLQQYFMATFAYYPRKFGKNTVKK